MSGGMAARVRDMEADDGGGFRGGGGAWVRVDDTRMCKKLGSYDTSHGGLSTIEAGYMMFTEAWRKERRLKGLLIESSYELRLVAGISTGALFLKNEAFERHTCVCVCVFCRDTTVACVEVFNKLGFPLLASLVACCKTYNTNDCGMMFGNSPMTPQEDFMLIACENSSPPCQVTIKGVFTKSSRKIRIEDQLSAKHQLAAKGLSECRASKSNIRRIQVKDIVKEVEDYLKTYSFAGMDISCLPRKWLSMNQTQRANNSIKNDSLAALYGKYHCEEGLIDDIYASKTQRFTIQASSSKALISNNHFQDSDPDVEKDNRINNEFMAELNAEYHERVLLANQKRFYKSSGRDEGTTKFKSFMAIAEDELSVGKSVARYGQWVEITMKKVHILLSMTDNEERKHVLDYTHVDFQYVEDQRINLVNKFNALKQDLTLHKSELCNLKNTVSINDSIQNKVIRVNLKNKSLNDEISDLKKVIEKWTCSKVTLDQLLSDRIPGNIVKALREKGKRKENNSKEVLFTKADVSTSESAPLITPDSEGDSDNQVPLPPLPKLTGAEPSGASKSLILLSDLTMENLNDTKVKQLRSDNGIKFRNHTLKALCDEKGDAINFNEVNSFPDDEFKPIITSSPLISSRSEDSSIPNIKDVVPALDEAVHAESATTFESTNLQKDDKDEPFNDHPSLQVHLPLAYYVSGPPVPQDKWSSKKHIELVNIIGEPLAGITTKSRIRDSKAASAHEYLYINFLSEIKPKKLIEAPEEEGWVLAMIEELNQFKRNKVRNLVPKPHDKTIIGLKWVFRNKMDEEGVVTKNKVTLVAKGYRQEEGIDYDETFTLVARLKAIRIFLAYASYMRFIVYQMDVKSAFLNEKISEEVYVEQPLGFESSEFPNLVCKLNKALYRLKQAPRAWYQVNPKDPHLVVVKRSFRKSTSGGCQILGGKLVCWSAKKQTSVAMSLTEAEYVVVVGCYA
nr:retrovirus-related Pol polyprotein from transposon TNT 1-94 [Tanacetum cinerariifolium]